MCLAVFRSAGARDSFPRALYLAGKFSKARAAFADGSSAVPEWSFLRWASQMLGVTGREEGPVVTKASFVCGRLEKKLKSAMTFRILSVVCMFLGRRFLACLPRSVYRTAGHAAVLRRSERDVSGTA